MIDEKPDINSLNLTALKRGDKAELASMVESFSNRIYLLALKMLNNTQDAEDAMQETFIKAIAALPRFEGRSSLSTWLYRIAVNEALMLIRKKKPDTISTDEETETESGQKEPMQITDWCCLPENELLNDESRKFLNDAIRKLPVLLSTVFTLRDLEGISIKETAEILGITETTVKTRLLRARLKLRNELSMYFKEKTELRGA